MSYVFISIQCMYPAKIHLGICRQLALFVRCLRRKAQRRCAWFHRSLPRLTRRSLPLNLDDLDIPDIDGDLQSYQREAGATFSVRTRSTKFQSFLPCRSCKVQEVFCGEIILVQPDQNWKCFGSVLVTTRKGSCWDNDNTRERPLY